MSDVLLLFGISGLSFDSPFLSPLLFFCLVSLHFWFGHFFVKGPFSCLFPQGTLSTFLFFLFFCMALPEQLGDDSWL